MAVMMIFPFTISGGMIALWMILLGVVAGAIPTATFAAAPEIMKKPELVGIGMVVVALGGTEPGDVHRAGDIWRSRGELRMGRRRIRDDPGFVAGPGVAGGLV